MSGAFFMKKIINKAYREFYRVVHPFLWGKRLQINGIPKITGESNLSLGYDVSINDNVFLQCSGGVFIEDRVTLSYGTTILTQGLDTKKYCVNSTLKFRKHIGKSVYVGEGTWIGANVTICPGSVVGKSCVVAAGAVVCGSLEENNCLYAGIPARKIKKL